MSRVGIAVAIGPIGPLRGHALRGDEGISRLYRFDVEVTTAIPEVLFDRLVLGRGAVVALHVGETVRVIHGIVASVRGLPDREGSRGLRRYGLRVVPRAWKLGRRRDSRIFQDTTVDAVLREVAEGLGVAIRFDLERPLPTRAYITQYDETDLAFFERLCAENGLLYSFEQPDTSLAPALFEALGGAGEIAAIGLEALREAALGPQPQGAETLVVTDRAAYAPIAPGGPRDLLENVVEGVLYEISGHRAPRPAGPALPLRAAGSLAGAAGAQQESILEFSLRERVTSTRAFYREFEPDRPLRPLEAKASIFPDTAGESDPILAIFSAHANPATALHALDASLEDRDLEVYVHEGRDLFPNAAFSGREPERVLAQARRRKRVARVRSNVARLEAGHTFALEEHPVDLLNSGWVVTRVRHRASSAFGGAEASAYENHAELVPMEVPFLPARPAPRVVQACMTATVVGPEGEEIHVDDQGRIKVKFHWDRREDVDEPTCWIRVMQAWAGTGWGTQMIPRVGMEAIVAFENGDPDKPLVLGCVYNRVLPTPFKLPEEKTKSGLRTHSTPRGDGYNELSFEDRTNEERIYVRAQRDLEAHVGRNRAATVGEDDTTTVRRDQRVQVGVDQHVHVVRDRHTDVRGDDHLRVHGGRHESVRGGLHVHASSRSTVVDSNDSTHVRGNLQLTAGNRIGVDAQTAIVSAGRSAILFGSARADVISGVRTTVHSDKEVFLSGGGKAFIRIAGDTIQISAPNIRLNAKDAQLVLGDGKARCKVASTFQVVSDDAVVLKSKAASLGLQTEARIDGAQVLLNSPSQASDKIEAETPPETRVVLTDDQGAALAGALVVVTCPDGSEIVGRTGADGSLTVDAPGTSTVTFPELSDTQ
ncbi:MAG: type VI secretion system tip protein TssI/VgrG [Polyangiaceae bacterium]